jgi:hypothetical protein
MAAMLWSEGQLALPCVVECGELGVLCEGVFRG